MEYVRNGWRGPSIYTGNSVTNELVSLVKEKCAEVPTVFVSFDVTGRTCHLQLGALLESKLGKEYDVDLDYMSYKCAVTRKEVHQ